VLSCPTRQMGPSMNNNPILVVDIEAIKDNSIPLPESSNDKWPPPVAWKVVAIGMLIAKMERYHGTERLKLEHLGCGAGDEKQIIRKFWSYFDQRRRTLITWNGRGYDIPVLLQRALVHAIPTPSWFQAGDRYNNYHYRYSTDWHCDLMDQLSDFGATSRTSLHTMASAMGLPGKLGGHGSEVETMYESGEMDRIRAYCECDVLNLYGLFLRWAYVTGRINEMCHDASFVELKDYLEIRTIEFPHCRDFLTNWKSAPATQQEQIGAIRAHA